MDLSWVVAIPAASVINSAELGVFVSPGALLLTPMIYSWLCPAGGDLEQLLLSFPSVLLLLPAGQTGQAGGCSQPPMNRTFVGKGGGLLA